MPELRGKTPEQLLSFVREHAHYSKLNAHWAPQYLHAIAGNRAVYSLHLLKVLRLKAPARELCNETTGALQEYATPLLHEVADFYARDVELFKCAA
jgi:hypothetical protein